MKKKAIERVPYIPAVRANRSYAYTASVVVTDISGAEHLLIDIYTNTKNGRKRPKVRLAYTRTDWGIYRPVTGKWSAGSCYSTDYSNEVWHGDDDNRQVKTFIHTDDESLIKRWTGFSNTYTDWVRALRSFEDNIRWNRQKNRYKNRQDRLAARQADTPPLPEDLEEWCKRRLFDGEHFLYYKRHGRYADVCCSACGQVTTVCTKRSESYESQFERFALPKQNECGICPNCKRIGKWKALGKTRNAYGLTRHAYIGQQFREQGAVIRYIEAETIYNIDVVLEDSREVMTGASESLRVTEIARSYIEPGRNIQRDYHKYNPYTGTTFWEDCNLAGMNNITLSDGLVYSGTWAELDKTCLKYSAAKEYAIYRKSCNLMEYAERYMRYKQLEFLTKAGFTHIVDELVKCRLGHVADADATNPADFLGINPERVKMLQEEKGDIQLLKALQREKRKGEHWNTEELELYRLFIYSPDLDTMLTRMSIIKLKHYLEKQTGVSIGAGMCGHASALVSQTYRTYTDYLGMRQQTGYALTDSIILFPKNLKQEHDKLVLEINKAKAEKREQEVNERFPDIKKHYRRIRRMYYYETDEYIIRPARSAAEIVQEGRILHHCVGGDTYLDRHNKGKSYILFLRPKGGQDTPYVTIEIKDNAIQQWYGAYDKKPDKDNIDALLNGYVHHLIGDDIQNRLMVTA